MAENTGKKGAGSEVGGGNSKKEKFLTKEVHASCLDERNQSGADLDNEILSKAEENYGRIVEKVIDVSKDQLEKEGEKKRNLRGFFTCFFSIFIAVQFVALLLFYDIVNAKGMPLSMTVLSNYG